MGAEGLAREECGAPVLASLVQRTKVYVLVWLCQLSHQCNRATAFPCADTSPSRNKIGPSVKGPFLEICNGEEINTERL